MRTVREKICHYLSQHQDGVDDDKLAAALNLKYRQQVNRVCRQLASEKIVERRRVSRKIQTFWKGSIKNIELSSREQRANPTIDDDEPWYWEGNIQAFIAQSLTMRGYSLKRLADTKRRQPGKDIEAWSNSGPLWVTVKGYPKGPPGTRHSTQAGHWFKRALFDVISWRGENPDAALAMALPDCPRYRNLARKIRWIMPEARFSLFWVSKDGAVSTEDGASSP